MASGERNAELAFAVSLREIESARMRLRGITRRTPLLECDLGPKNEGGRLFIKCEGLQWGGSFKFRGAFNRLVQLSLDERQAGVVAWSSGNHAQGVALAAKRLGIHAAIVMPADAPAIKLARTQELGAEVIRYDRYRESREDIARELAGRRGATLVPSFDDPAIIAGQGTAGLELLDQMDETGQKLDQLLVCCGGGGLSAGIAMAVRSLRPEVSVYSVEPEQFDDTSRSLRSGRRETNRPGARSICDALLAPTPGKLTFPINRHFLAGGLTVSDKEVLFAMAFAFDRLKIVCEPGGAVALAAALFGKFPLAGRNTAVIVSGSNVDPPLFREALARLDAAPPIHGAIRLRAPVAPKKAPAGDRA